MKKGTRSKSIKIPLYTGKLIIIQTDDLEKVNIMFDTMFKTHGYDAITFMDEEKNGFTNYVVAFQGKPSASTIGHESMHVLTYIYKEHGIRLSINNDEPQAYLIGWIIGELHKFLKIKA